MTHGLFIVVTQPQAVHWVRSGHILRNKYVKQLPKTTFAQRRAVLQSLLDFIVAHQDEICHVACRDTGKTRKYFSVGLKLYSII
jgi:hypothetical protein